MERRIAALEARYASPPSEDRTDMILRAWIRTLEMDDLELLARIERRQLTGETLDQIRRVLEPEILNRLEQLDSEFARFIGDFLDSSGEGSEGVRKRR